MAPIWGELKYQLYLGGDKFIDGVKKRIADDDGGDLKEVPRIQHRVVARTLEWYQTTSATRDEGIVSAYHSGDYMMQEIAKCFGVHYSTVSRAVKKSEMFDCKT